MSQEDVATRCDAPEAVHANNVTYMSVKVPPRSTENLKCRPVSVLARLLALDWGWAMVLRVRKRTLCHFQFSNPDLREF